MRIYDGWNAYNAAWTQPISMLSTQVPPPKVPDLWKSTTLRAGTSWEAHFYPQFYLDPGYCGRNTQSTRPTSLVPGESSCGGNGANMCCNISSNIKLVWNPTKPMKIYVDLNSPKSTTGVNITLKSEISYCCVVYSSLNYHRNVEETLWYLTEAQIPRGNVHLHKGV